MKTHIPMRKGLVAIIIAMMLSLSSCGLFKKCGECPSFSKTAKPVENTVCHK